jgi:hypothetical protein
MSDQENDPLRKPVPLRDLKTKSGSEDLLDSPAMEPYMNLAVAVTGGKDTVPAIEEIAALPLEKGYVWRVASALKWAFADLETLNVEVDRQTLSPEDQEQLLELLKHRPLQLCLFLSGIFGQEQMELMMVSAIRNAMVVAAQSPRGLEHP